MYDSGRCRVDPALADRFVKGQRYGTLNFRAVQFECAAELSTDPSEVAAALARLLVTYEPDASYTPIQDGAFYGPRLRRLSA